jgi:hypothetical protein
MDGPDDLWDGQNADEVAALLHPDYPPLGVEDTLDDDAYLDHYYHDDENDNDENDNDYDVGGGMDDDEDKGEGEREGEGEGEVLHPEIYNELTPFPVPTLHHAHHGIVPPPPPQHPAMSSSGYAARVPSSYSPSLDASGIASIGEAIGAAAAAAAAAA